MQTLIVLGGERPSVQLLVKIAKQSDLIIAADSGFHAFDNSGVLPQILVGDFDSIDPKLDLNGVKVIEAPEQTATDFEKALRYLPEHTNRVIILGGVGLRSDHFLTNLLIAANIRTDLTVTFTDDLQYIHRILPEQNFSANLRLDQIVSLIPFTECRDVTTTGLKWNLNNANMGIGQQLGQSNVVVEESVKISIKEGVLYFVENWAGSAG